MAIVPDFIRSDSPRGNRIIQTPTYFKHCILNTERLTFTKALFLSSYLPTYNKLYSEKHTNPALVVVHSFPPRPPLVQELQGPPPWAFPLQELRAQGQQAPRHP